MHGENVDPNKRRKMIEGLQSCPSVRKAAEYAGVWPSSIYAATKHDEHVRKALEDHQRRGGQGRKRRTEPVEAVQGLRTLALKRLEEVLRKEGTSTRDIVSASRVVLDATRPALPTGPAVEPVDHEKAARLQAEAAATGASKLKAMWEARAAELGVK